jgi:UPF0176 protein
VPNTPVQIAAFYHFGPVPPKNSTHSTGSIETLRAQLEDSGRQLGLKGLVILAVEGMNGTVCGATQEIVLEWLTRTSSLLGFPYLSPKWSTAPVDPFRRFGVRIRDEIVTLGKPEIQPLAPGSKTHLTPDEWDEMMASGDAVVLDTRNWYETRIGTFKGAIDPKTEEFSEFSKVVNEKAQAGEIPKNKKVMIFCTGGIRCEKAIVEMQNSGFNEVYQLGGGILNYLAQKPHGNFEGECFVFDHRVAVDQDLQPSVQYSLCPHCGQPADQLMDCIRCEASTQICVTCAEKEDALKTCSKNCANHYRDKPGKKGKSQGLNYRFRPTGR